MMHSINRILRRLGLPFRYVGIDLIAHQREGGYTYITSPDLPGFTFMLEPGEEQSIGTVASALEGPLAIYLEAYFKAQDKADGVQLSGLRRTKSHNFVAELCPA